MRRFSFSTIILAMLLSFSACVSPAVPVMAEQPVPVSASESELAEPSAPPEPEIVEQKIPYEEQIASITPQVRERIPEKTQENSDAVGWLTVPDTTIDAVILKNPSGNNNYYTTHDFSRALTRDGAYGADYNGVFSGGRENLNRNTPLYAHNHDDNPDGILFAQLKKYKDPEYAKAHPYIFFSTADEDMAWEIFAVYDASVDFPYILSGEHWDFYSKVLDAVYDASIYDYGVSITAADKLLTLSTCTFSVPGHESMPITERNIYRFVVMARLLEPEAPIQKEAVFTVNDNPLPPDELPSFDFQARDLFMLNGLECGNATIFFTNNDNIEPVDFDRLVPVGQIKRSNMDENLGDWDATQLPVGTVIYQDSEYTDVFAADIGGKKIPYVAQKWERELLSMRYIHQNDAGVITDKSLDVEAFYKNEQAKRLDAFVDMIRYTPLPDDIDTVQRRDDKEEIRLGAKNSLSTFYQTFFLGVPPSVGTGKEVLIIKQSDGCYYGDAALYAQLSELLEDLFA